MVPEEPNVVAPKPEPPPRQTDSVLRHALRHPNIALGAVILLAAMAHLLALAGGDDEVLQALVAYADIPKVVLGVSVTLITIFPAFWALGVWNEVGERLIRGFGVSGDWYLIAIASAVLTFAVTPLAVVLIAAVVFAFSMIIDIAAFRGSRSRVPTTFSGFSGQGLQRRTVWVAILAFVIAGLAWYDRPFIPAEEFTRTNGEKVVGYELAESGNSVVVLVYDPERSVAFIQTNDIAARSLCDFYDDDLISRPALQAIQGVPEDNPNAACGPVATP